MEVQKLDEALLLVNRRKEQPRHIHNERHCDALDELMIIGKQAGKAGREPGTAAQTSQPASQPH